MPSIVIRVSLCLAVIIVKQTLADPDMGELSKSLDNVRLGVVALTAAVDDIKKQLATINKPNERCPNKCPSDFKYLSNVNGCYKPITSTALPWIDALNYCPRVHPSAHLLFLNSVNEKNAVASMLNKVDGSSCPIHQRHLGLSWWTGGQRKNPNSAGTPFVWKTSASGAAVSMTYTNWGPNEPNGLMGLESCIHMVKSWDYAWNDEACRWTQCFVCEIDL